MVVTPRHDGRQLSAITILLKYPQSTWRSASGATAGLKCAAP